MQGRQGTRASMAVLRRSSAPLLLFGTSYTHCSSNFCVSQAARGSETCAVVIEINAKTLSHCFFSTDVKQDEFVLYWFLKNPKDKSLNVNTWLDSKHWSLRALHLEPCDTMIS